jgi:archaellum biogenesis ATPase FlaH
MNEIGLFLSKIVQIPAMHMIWGEGGTGKSTFALQLCRTVLQHDQKVFYLHTKSSPISAIINRLLKPLSSEQQSRLQVWQVDTLNKQMDIILGWLLQIQQLKTFFAHQQVGLIVCDEIALLYLHEMGSEKKNESLNQQFTLLLGTLAKIAHSQNIPVLLINTFSNKLDEETDKNIAIPHGGKMIDYWTKLNPVSAGIEFSVMRTPQLSRMKFSITHKPEALEILESWTWLLSDSGFA